MKIAVISDIHGNIFALEAVLQDIFDIGVDRIFFLGDLTGYYYHPKEVLYRLIEIKATMILGNHEKLLFDCVDGKLDPNILSLKYGSGHRIALEEFSISDINYLRSLPDFFIENLNDLSIGCFHGSPFNPDFYIYPDASFDILQKCDVGLDLVFVGHSHYPFVIEMDYGKLINVGSVGQSRTNGGVASWCFFDSVLQTVELKSTHYDTQNLLKLVQLYDPEIPYLRNVLKRTI